MVNSRELCPAKERHDLAGRADTRLNPLLELTWPAFPSPHANLIPEALVHPTFPLWLQEQSRTRRTLRLRTRGRRVGRRVTGIDRLQLDDSGSRADHV